MKFVRFVVTSANFFFLPTSTCISLDHTPNTVFVADETVQFLSVPRLMRLNVGWSLRKSGLDHRPVFVGYVVDGVTMSKGFLRVYLYCFPISVSPLVLCAHSFSAVIRTFSH